MQNKIKVIISAGLLLMSTIFSGALPLPAFGQINSDVSINCSDIKAQGNVDPACTANVGKLLASVITIAFIVAVLLALLFLVVGGVRWILSGGDKEGTAKARGMITAAIVGLAIVFLSFIVIKILGTIFGFDINNIRLPQLNHLNA